MRIEQVGGMGRERIYADGLEECMLRIARDVELKRKGREEGRNLEQPAYHALSFLRPLTSALRSHVQLLDHR